MKRFSNNILFFITIASSLLTFAEAATPIRIMSYNTETRLSPDLPRGDQQIAKIKEGIANNDLVVICFQELFVNDRDKENLIAKFGFDELYKVELLDDNEFTTLVLYAQDFEEKHQVVPKVEEGESILFANELNHKNPDEDSELYGSRGVMFTKITIGKHLYLIGNLYLNTHSDEVTNEEFVEIYTKATLIKNEYLYGVTDIAKIAEKKGKADDGKQFTCFLAGSFIKTVDNKFLETIKDKEDEEFLAALKGNVNNGPLIDWMKRDKVQYEDFKAANDPKMYGKIQFSEEAVTFNPTEFYVATDDADLESRKGDFDIGDKEKMSYSERILYFTTDDFEFKAYDMQSNINLSPSKLIFLDAVDKTENERDEERKLFDESGKGFSLRDRIKKHIRM